MARRRFLIVAPCHVVRVARCFGEAKATFLDLSKDVHHRCAELLKPGAFEERPEETKRVMSRFMVLSNRGIDMTFGKLKFAKQNGLALDAYRFDTLDFFYALASRARIAEVA